MTAPIHLVSLQRVQLGFHKLRLPGLVRQTRK